ncbi:MAG: CPBP family intramembrane metalloprotease [Oscillospiraceae bacterium]|nr:CPBP family intramembrane metalloprotease [Oscillospiraceae bacterium]
MKLTQKQTALLLYIPLFYLAWAGVELLLVPVFEREFPPDSTMLFFIKEGILKVLIWVVPAVLLMRRFDGELYVPLKEMFTQRFDFLRFLMLLGGVCVFLIVMHLIQSHSLQLHFKWRLLGYVLVGITEEIAFRGWLLNAMHTEKTAKYMAEVNAVMFLLIHLPIWIHEHLLAAAFGGLGFLSVLAIGFVFAWSFLHFRSIYPPILLHIAYDVLITAMQ